MPRGSVVRKALLPVWDPIPTGSPELGRALARIGSNCHTVVPSSPVSLTKGLRIPRCFRRILASNRYRLR